MSQSQCMRLFKYFQKSIIVSWGKKGEWMEYKDTGMNIIRFSTFPARLAGRAALGSVKRVVEATNHPGIVDRLKSEQQEHDKKIAEDGLAHAKEIGKDQKFEITQLCHVVKILGKSCLRKIENGEEITQDQLFLLQCGKDDLPQGMTFESLGFSEVESEKLEKALTDLSITSLE